MQLKNKKRKIPRSISWRMDQDYIKELSAADKAWMEQFNLEYYLAKELDSPDTLHPENLVDELHQKYYSSQVDIVTATHPVKAKNKNKSRYSPLDYPTKEFDPVAAKKQNTKKTE